MPYKEECWPNLHNKYIIIKSGNYPKLRVTVYYKTLRSIQCVSNIKIPKNQNVI